MLLKPVTLGPIASTSILIREKDTSGGFEASILVKWHAAGEVSTPVIARLRTNGCRLDVIELNWHHGETHTPEQGNEALAACSVAILTGTSLINGTCDDLL